MLDNFDDRYLGAKTGDPSVDNDGNALLIGALYFNTTDGVMKVYTASGWIAASSASVATLATFEFVATAGQTVFSGADANSATLSYVAPALIVTLNGVRLRPGDDYTATNGTSITLVSAAALNDELVVDAFGSFLVANAVDLTTTQTISGTKTFSNPITASAGTVSAPSITTTGDSNTGIFFPAADTIAFAEGGTEVMRMDSAGNIGIGTNSPTQKLTVAGFGAFSGANRGVTLGEDNCTILGTSATLNSANMVFYTANTERMRINTSGYVTTPNQPAFSAFRDAGSVTGNNTSPTVIVFNNATFANVGSHYSTSTGRFTAPVAGVYYFSFSGMLDSTPNNAGDLQLAIRKNGTNLSISNPPQVGASIQGMGFAASANVTLAASDYVDVVFYASNNSSRLYAAGGVFNNFSGFLIG